MNEVLIHEKADRIRDVIRYIKKFRNAVVVVYLDDRLLDSPNFSSHIRDICLIHEAGLKVILVPGAAKRISEILTEAKIQWSFHNNCRITPPQAMPLIKMAAFDVSNQIMTSFAGEKVTSVIGNWVRARSKGVIDGFDYGTSGEIDKLQIDAVKTILDNGFIPIFPCIGWSAAGKPYNISSVQLSQQIAIHLKADKLFYMVSDAEISSDNFTIPENIGTSAEGTVPAMNIEEVDQFIETNKALVNSMEISENSTEPLVVFKDKQTVSCETIFTLLKLAKTACNEGVDRVHIINGSIDGTVPCEIFSDLGSGTMIYTNNYGKIRQMTRDDISEVITLMQPFVNQGILLQRTKEQLDNQYQNYIVYELDGAIRACSALIPYPDGQMEIAAVAVDKTCSNIGIGPKMIKFLVKQAKEMKASGLFLLTTQTSDWFENLGFIPSEVSTLPQQRKEKWTPERGSKVLRYKI
ncbi:MAG: amino-acid N-acetyltransferase [Treponema sp.]|uniref:amino-acid N-acetyltransferase n=1 Tax=Treponema sp. TaxID=166 RepID=UPI001D68259A|nr:amino-acid N-acetyltransferase [Treponema sp.]MBS7242509.1 amino-acid N-acetyltransferase [Treponema sp.]